MNTFDLEKEINRFQRELVRHQTKMMIENIKNIHATINESIPPSKERKNIVQNILATIKKILHTNSSKEIEENIDSEALEVIQKIF